MAGTSPGPLQKLQVRAPSSALGAKRGGGVLGCQVTLWEGREAHPGA